jgi:uncharacterized phage protein (TIGR02218 family)
MSRDDLFAHLGTGVTHTCRCWEVRRTDGVRLGFTDHDCPLEFDGLNFTPQGGLTARALASSAGLSVDNTSALGVLSDARISEADIAAGRFDGAEVTVWLVCWDDTEARQIQFRGTIGEITRANGAFEAELNGLAEPLNQPRGRSYLRTCSAVLGDGACAVDLSDPAFRYETVLAEDVTGTEMSLPVGGFAEGWFAQGLCEVLTGAAQGLRQAVRQDVIRDDRREVALWAPFPLLLRAGDRIRLTAGCDKRAVTCREKFSNFLNFRGFPDMPGEDWLVSVPRSGGSNKGGSLVR